MSRTGSPERCTSAKATSETPSATMAAWPSRRTMKGSASRLHVGVARPDVVVGAHLEALRLLRHPHQLVELPQEDPDRLVVEALLGLAPELLALARVEGALVLLDGGEKIARGVEVAEAGEA